MSLPISFWIIFVYKLKVDNYLLNAIIGASAWTILEYIRAWLVALSVYGTETIFGPHNTYYSLAYTVSSVPVLRDLLAVGGIYLVSFVIILINYFLYRATFFTLFGNRKNKQEFLLLFFLIITIISGSFFVAKNIREKEKEGSVFLATVVNADLPSSSSVLIDKDKYLASVEVIKEDKNKDGVIILPENFNVLTSFLNKESDHFDILESKNLIIGSFSGRDFYNMYFLKPKEGSVEYYRKQLLMPLGEYSINSVAFLIKIFSGKNLEDSYSAKKSFNKKLFKDSNIDNLVIGGSICSENISPYIYRNETKLGATVLVNVRSHAHFHRSTLLHRQTLAIDRARAIENGRYFIVSSNQGASYVITDKGDIKSDLFSKLRISSFVSEIEIKDYITPYVKYGDYILHISLVVLVATFYFMA